MKIISSSTIFCVGLFFLSTCIKILLFPAYRSTDFDVHRNWLAITKNLPVSQWYFDDVNGTTVHTLDYPPSFAFFEYFWSSNPITKKIFQYYYHRVHGSDSAENERCLELLPDSDNSPSVFCVYFQRSTVILSDFIFLIGAIFASYSLFYTVTSHRQEQDTSSKGLSTQQQQQFNKFNSQQTRSFSIATLLIVFNPGIMILDHVHFQYNGMLLGFLLISMGFLNLGMSSSSILQTADNEKRKIKWDILGAIFFAVLITMKHLYMTLAPLYFVYLLRHCCFTPTSRNTLNSINSKIGKTRELSFSMKAFCKLSIVTATCLITPFLPFCLSSSTYSIQSQLIQILKRLFPFARGLCHDYWAANVWALYLFFQKILLFISTKLLRNDTFTEVLLKLLPVDSEIPPSATAILLLLSLMPALILTWTRSEPFKITHNSSFNEKVLEKRSFFILAVVSAQRNSNCCVLFVIVDFLLAHHILPYKNRCIVLFAPLCYLIMYMKKLS